MLIAASAAEVQILDYSSAQSITIDTGSAKVQAGTFKIIHSIDLKQYKVVIEELEMFLTHNSLEKDPIFPYLKNEIIQIKTHLNRLMPSPKVKRSIDFIGSAWKFISGSPDKHDFDVIKEKINNVLTNNNNQIVINKMLIKKIDEVVNTTNIINKKMQEDNNVKDEIVLNIELRLGLIKEEIVNLEYAIHWAKANIVNSYILSNIEIDIIQKILNKENMPYVNILEALEFAEIKIASNNSLILYMISLPTTTVETCKTILIKSIKKGKTILKIPYSNVLQCKNKIYGVMSSCLVFHKLSICQSNNIIDITNSTCIPHLLNSRASNCTRINNQHVPSVEEVAPGILLLNQYTGSIEVNEEMIPLDGSYLIQFHNTSIRIQNQVFKSTEVVGYKPLPAVLQPTSIRKDTEELLSLQMIKELHAKNSEYIDLLETRNKYNGAAIITLLILFAALIIVYLLKLKKKKNSIIAKIVTADEMVMTDASAAEDPVPLSPIPTPRSIGMEDLPSHIKPWTSNEAVRF